MWSRHSRRTEPRNRSQVALTCGERTGHLMTRVPAPRAWAIEFRAELAVSVTDDELGAVADGVAFRSCCATHNHLQGAAGAHGNQLKDLCVFWCLCQKLPGTVFFIPDNKFPVKSHTAKSFGVSFHPLRAGAQG